MARPRMDEMRANLPPGFNSRVCTGSPPACPGQTVNPWSASGGNPKLKPGGRTPSTSPTNGTSIRRPTSLAGFYKKLDTYIYTRVRLLRVSAADDVHDIRPA